MAAAAVGDGLTERFSRQSGCGPRLGFEIWWANTTGLF